MFFFAMSTSFYTGQHFPSLLTTPAPPLSSLFPAFAMLLHILFPLPSFHPSANWTPAQPQDRAELLTPSLILFLTSFPGMPMHRQQLPSSPSTWNSILQCDSQQILIQHSPGNWQCSRHWSCAVASTNRPGMHTGYQLAQLLTSCVTWGNS